MTQITVPIFLEVLQRSRLIDEPRLNVACAKMREELGPDKREQLDAVTRWFVSQNYVTEWQMRQLLRKRYKGFFLRQYKILSHIGTGGMSTVYLAEHSVMQRRVAIKVLPKKKLENSIYLDRFIREAQTVASLDHPNIVRAYDIDQEDDVHYIVMEHFNGRNLQEVVAQDGVMSFEMAADYIRQAALALEYAHQAGVVHRDVKPGNVLVNDQGLVKVLDLGLALFDEHRFDGNLTSIQEDKILGTADYLAPEQGIDSHTVDGRADIYGLGGVLYFCLTGHPPFPTGTIPQRLLAHQHEEPQSIFVDRPEAPDSLVRLCRKMMAKKKENRQQTALEVVVDMQHWLIDNGFADEADFPPLETLRATNETLGAVPIPTQEQRLRNLDGDQWLVRQQRQHDRQGDSRLRMTDGHSDMIGSVDRDAAGRFGLDSPPETDDSTVSGMMRPMRRRGGPGHNDSSGGSRAGNTQTGSASSTGAGSAAIRKPISIPPSDAMQGVGVSHGLGSASGSGNMTGTGDSASRIHLLTDGQSSALMPGPNANTPTERRRGIANDDDSDQTLGAKHSPAEENNDPVLFALSEMGLAEQPQPPKTQNAKIAARQAVQSVPPTRPVAPPQSQVTPVAMVIAPPQRETSSRQAASQAARTVSQALAAELHDEKKYAGGSENHSASHVRPWHREWHRNVPLWFWCLFGLFVISTIFLTGIIVALIIRG